MQILVVVVMSFARPSLFQIPGNPLSGSHSCWVSSLQSLGSMHAFFVRIMEACMGMTFAAVFLDFCTTTLSFSLSRKDCEKFLFSSLREEQHHLLQQEAVWERRLACLSQLGFPSSRSTSWNRSFSGAFLLVLHIVIESK